MPIIALCGKRRVGKDVFGGILEKEYGYKRVAFGDPLKEFCSKVFNLHLDYFNSDDLKDKEFDRPIALDFHHVDKMRELLLEYGYEVDYETREKLEDFVETTPAFKSPRHILRVVGTNMVRGSVDDKIWINKAIEIISNSGHKVVVTDCRFESERKALRKLGAILVKIKRHDDGSTIEHEFDLGPDSDYDVIFDNSFTLNEYTSNVKTWYTLRRSDLEYYYDIKDIKNG